MMQVPPKGVTLMSPKNAMKSKMLAKKKAMASRWKKPMDTEDKKEGKGCK